MKRGKSGYSKRTPVKDTMKRPVRTTRGNVGAGVKPKSKRK